MYLSLARITRVDSCEPYVGWQYTQALESTQFDGVYLGWFSRPRRRPRKDDRGTRHPLTELTQGCGTMVIPTASIFGIERLSISEMAF